MVLKACGVPGCHPELSACHGATPHWPHLLLHCPVMVRYLSFSGHVTRTSW